MDRELSNEGQQLRTQIDSWIQNHLKVCDFGQDTWEIAGYEKDALGDTVYCFVEKEGSHYRVSDGGRTIFKLDPSISDDEMIATAEEIILDSGFEFTPKSTEIWQITTNSELIATIMYLIRLTLALSYLNY